MSDKAISLCKQAERLLYNENGPRMIFWVLPESPIGRKREKRINNSFNYLFSLKDFELVKEVCKAHNSLSLGDTIEQMFEKIISSVNKK